MKRILIIGSSGAGKSTLARRLGEITGLEVVHLDRLHWKPNWVEPPKDEWQEIVRQALQKDSWIMDGNYSGTIEMRIEGCDTVIFLDYPRLTCIYRVLKRVALYKKNGRPDMAEGCDEKFDWKFLIWIWNYPKRSKPKIEKLLGEFKNKRTIVRLKTGNEIENFLSDLPVCKLKS